MTIRYGVNTSGKGPNKEFNKMIDIMHKLDLISVQIPIIGGNLPLFGIGIVVGYAIIVTSIICINLVRHFNLAFLVSILQDCITLWKLCTEIYSHANLTKIS